MGAWRTRPERPHDPAYDPAGEVVELCRDLIRIDTTQLRRRVRDRGSARRPSTSPRCSTRSASSPSCSRLEPGRTSSSRTGAAPDGDGRAAAARPPRRRPGGGRGLAGRPVLRRDPGRLRLGPRRGRHEGLRRDAALGRAGPRPGRARCPTRPIVLCFTADEEAGGHQGAEVLVEDHREQLEDCTEAVGEVGGFSTTVRGRRLYLIEAAEKGMAWMRLTARGRAGHGSMINRDNAVTALAAAVARIGAHEWPVRLTPDDAGAAGRRRRAGRHRGDARRTPRRWSRSSAAPPGCSARSSATPPTRPCSSAGYKVNVVPDRGHRPRRRPVPAGLRGRVLRHPRRAVRRRASTSTTSPSSTPWETPYDGDLVDAMTPLAARRGPRRARRAVPDERRHRRQALQQARACAATASRRCGCPADLDFTALFHGVDERVPVDALEFGARVFDRFLDEV